MPPVSEAGVGVADGDTGALSQADCLCPICLEIFLEPVTLPCTHTFCKPCFLETVDKANLCCPMCRKRVSTWARLHGRNKTLVNVDLWRRVQDAFPTLCQRRLSGQDVEDDSTPNPRPKVSLPGEVRREYEDQVGKLAEEKRALEEAERRASEEYIQQLLAQEEERLAEERRRQEEKQLEEDEKLARLLSQELNSSQTAKSQRNVRPVDNTSAKKKKNNAGDIGRFLFPVPLRFPSAAEGCTATSSITANKENIQDLQLEPCLSMQKVEATEPIMPTLDFYGKEAGGGGREEGLDLEENTDLCTLDIRTSLMEQGEHGQSSSVTPTRKVSFSKSKRKSTAIQPETDCDTVSKRPRLIDAPLLQELAQMEEDLFSRRQQEETDRQLALRLQRELDQEEAHRAVDRRKGSADQYPLRDKFLQENIQDLQLEPCLSMQKVEATEPIMPTLDFYGKEAGGGGREEGLDLEENTDLCTLDIRTSLMEQGEHGQSSSVTPTRKVSFSKSKRKSTAIQPETDCDTVSKRPRLIDAPLLQELAQMEEDLFSRRQQEETDRQLALRLQRELDQEEAHRAVDRRKGSADQYPLRDKPGPSPSPAVYSATCDGAGSKPSRGHSGFVTAQKDENIISRPRVSSSTPIPASNNRPKAQKGSKQTTLTKMFSSLHS